LLIKYKIIIGIILVIILSLGSGMGYFWYQANKLETTIAKKETEITELNAKIVDLTSRNNLLLDDQTNKQNSIDGLQKLIDNNEKICDTKMARVNELYKICIDSKVSSTPAKTTNSTSTGGTTNAKKTQDQQYIDLYNSIIRDIKR